MAAADTPRETRASRALSAKLSAKHGEQGLCSRRTKIPQSRLSRIAAGKLFPRADEGARFVEEGIPIHWWDEPPLDEQPAHRSNPTGTDD
jgi:hypothetical protein